MEQSVLVEEQEGCDGVWGLASAVVWGAASDEGVRKDLVRKDLGGHGVEGAGGMWMGGRVEGHAGVDGRERAAEHSGELRYFLACGEERDKDRSGMRREIRRASNRGACHLAIGV